MCHLSPSTKDVSNDEPYEGFSDKIVVRCNIQDKYTRKLCLLESPLRSIPGNPVATDLENGLPNILI